MNLQYNSLSYRHYQVRGELRLTTLLTSGHQLLHFWETVIVYLAIRMN